MVHMERAKPWQPNTRADRATSESRNISALEAQIGPDSAAKVVRAQFDVLLCKGSAVCSASHNLAGSCHRDHGVLVLLPSSRAV